jgi:uncharacterized C2H2 Zn-finger protein
VLWVAAALASGPSWAEGIALFGPSKGGMFMLVVLPLLGSAVLALCMLFSKSTFMALLSTCFLASLWVVGCLASIDRHGLFMLALTPWGLFASLLIAYLISVRGTESPPTGARMSEVEIQALSADGETMGRCPNCEAVIALASAECPKCGAQFSSKAAWSVEPL